ncbi:APC family permease [bacterium]|nr:APC family permease [bacterium]MBU1985047.1 APC family permease [bacterium]
MTQPGPIDNSTRQNASSLLPSLWRKIVGGRRNPFDPRIFQHISLIAFFAWVGLGADGLSSANYGPEEAFLALRNFRFLAPLLAVIIAGTVLIISASYTQIIEQFPTGGGGYLVASKLIHPNAGAVAGSALIVDYILTIAVSVTAGVDALFSLFPTGWEMLRIYVAILAVAFLVIMNLRGVKESVMTLLPIFMLFVVTHVGLVVFGFVTHVPDIPARAAEGFEQAQSTLSDQGGLLLLLGVLLHAFSMGAGTLTGIEAVANGMLVLKEPRVQTGKRTMAYMAASLSFLAAFLLFNFFLFGTEPAEGKTLNAVLFGQITSGWHAAGINFGELLIWIMLISASLLLFVAAQTGFIGGPRVIANMAEDSWLPHRFGHLSERLVTQNGILLMGLAAIGFILYARGSVRVLVALYAINVFMDFTMAQLGMSKLWISRRKTDPRWRKRILVSGLGFVVCAALLVIMILMKFTRGAWLILIVTSILVAICFAIRRHYREVESRTKKLDDILATLPFGEETVTREPLKAMDPTAVILVQRYSGQGVHVLLNIHRLFGSRFKQYIFVSVGAIDTGHFKGVDELAALRKEVEAQAAKYVTLARSYGFRAEARTSCAIDYLTEIERLCLDVHQECPNTVFFGARLLFWKDTVFTRLLHNETPLALQRRLMFHGLQFVVLPIRLQ